MGSPLGPVFANIFLAIIIHEQRLIQNNKIQDLIKWYWYVDDILAIFVTKPDMDTTLHELNSVHDNSKFTSECKKDGNFHFLYVNINLWMVSFIQARMLNQLTQFYIYFGQVFLITRIKWAYFIAYCFAHLDLF